MTAEDCLKLAARALDDKKAVDLKAIRVGDLTVLADYFLIATATSTTHVRALADEVEERLKEAGCEMHHSEGKSTGWIVLDYRTVIVHIFTPQQREFYALDRMWSDGTPIDVTQFTEETAGEKQ